MREQNLIEIFSRVHGTRPFGADAEIVPFGGTNLLVSTDSFSEREDFLFGPSPAHSRLVRARTLVRRLHPSCHRPIP